MDFDAAAALDKLLALGRIERVPLTTATDLPIGDVADVPQGHTLISLKKYLDEYAPRPDRRVGTDIVQDLDSFASWMNRHKDTHSLLFCDTSPTKPRLVGIVDYHLAGPPSTPENAETALAADDRARFRGFRAQYDFPVDARWQAWRAVDGKALGQAEMAAFLEDHVLDLIAQDESLDGDGNPIAPAPDTVTRFLALMGGACARPNEMVALSRGLDVTLTGKVANRVNMQSGERALVYEEVHSNGNGEKLVVPQLFLIAIPVFHRSPLVYRVPVRLRYRIDGGKVVWVPTLFGADDIFDRAIRDAGSAAREATALPLIYGTPA